MCVRMRVCVCMNMRLCAFVDCLHEILLILQVIVKKERKKVLFFNSKTPKIYTQRTSATHKPHEQKQAKKRGNPREEYALGAFSKIRGAERVL